MNYIRNYNKYRKINESLKSNHGDFEVGDWVKLGEYGWGWGSDLEGEIAKIKEISKNIHFDITLDSDSNPKLKGEQCAGEDRYNVVGCNSIGLIPASEKEISDHKEKYDIHDDDEPFDDRFEKWEETVNEEYNYENNRFEIGDKVRIKPTSPHYNQQFTSNIKDDFKNDRGYGVITMDYLCRNYTYQVNWEYPKYSNGYRIADLELTKENPIDDRFEKWEENKSYYNGK